MRRDGIYFGALGLVVALAGIVAVLRGVGVGITDPHEIVPLVTVAGTFLVWRGLILLLAGWLFLTGATDGLDDRENQATVVMAGLMLWIVAGADLLSRVLGAIPGGPDVWIAGPTEVVAALGPPYGPALLAAPLALLAVQYRHSDGDEP
ncbi:MAG: hypothetical protein ABEI98_03180 [Halorhabdus sp.]